MAAHLGLSLTAWHEDLTPRPPKPLDSLQIPGFVVHFPFEMQDHLANGSESIITLHFYRDSVPAL